MNTTINIILFGIGKVGSTLINQVLASAETISKQQHITLQIPIIANSSTAFFSKNGVKNNWQTDFEEFGFPYNIQKISNYIKHRKLDNVIVVDATASESFVKNYKFFAKQGFHIVTANKIANTISQQFYNELRNILQTNNVNFNYETNVGAGLPIIDTIKQLHQSGEKIHKIRGVFSGSLSYIFNTYSNSAEAFSSILKDADNKGFTEPDVRDDLSGKDVARKLLILAREIGIQKEFSEIKINSLLPSNLNGKTTQQEFKSRVEELNLPFSEMRNNQQQDHVLRYVGELNVDTGTLETKLISEPKTNPLGQLKGADALIEIYSESYSDQPLVIQGAGAGNAVTARGVLADILKIGRTLKN